jgi:hypothetical protein
MTTHGILNEALDKYLKGTSKGGTVGRSFGYIGAEHMDDAFRKTPDELTRLKARHKSAGKNWRIVPLPPPNKKKRRGGK